MAGHTPGEWYINVLETKALAICGHGLPICIMEVQPYGNTDANAHLIAAAPDLLAALEFVAELSMYPGVAVKRRWSDAVSAAIAKAKGEQSGCLNNPVCTGNCPCHVYFMSAECHEGCVEPAIAKGETP